MAEQSARRRCGRVDRTLDPGRTRVSVLRQKMFRDLWRERTRALCVVAAMALGIAAFWSVLPPRAILTRGLNDGYAATNPASAVLYTDAVDAALLAGVRSLPGVADVEARRTVRARLKAGPAAWRNLVLFVVDDYGAI